jgi:hypothetical protein
MSITNNPKTRRRIPECGIPQLRKSVAAAAAAAAAVVVVVVVAVVVVEQKCSISLAGKPTIGHNPKPVKIDVTNY